MSSKEHDWIHFEKHVHSKTFNVQIKYYRNRPYHRNSIITIESFEKLLVDSINEQVRSIYHIKFFEKSIETTIREKRSIRDKRGKFGEKTTKRSGQGVWKYEGGGGGTKVAGAVEQSAGISVFGVELVEEEASPRLMRAV